MRTGKMVVLREGGCGGYNHGLPERLDAASSNGWDPPMDLRRHLAKQSVDSRDKSVVPLPCPSAWLRA